MSAAAGQHLFSPSPRVAGSADAAFEGLSGPALVVVDENLRDSGGFGSVLDAARRVGDADDLQIVTVSGLGSLEDAEQLAGVVSRAAFVVAYGGGSTLDRAKLGRMLASGYDFPDPELDLMRGWWPLADHGATTVPFVAVPTTLGTGSERNGNAVVEALSGRHLVSGTTLLPTVALVSPEQLATLPAELVLGGVYEALARMVEAFTSPGTVSADELALAIAGELVRAGDAVADRGPSSDLITTISRLSALTQSPNVNSGRARFAFRAWCVSHELAAISDAPKVNALATVLPRLHAAGADPRGRFGDRTRRRTILGSAASTTARTSDTLLLDLAADWRLSELPRTPNPRALAIRILERWGGEGERAHLENFSLDDLEPFL